MDIKNGRKVILTAEHHNSGLHTIDDWQQTKFILFEDGVLQTIVFEGRKIRAHERTLREDELMLITDNIKEFIYNTPDIDACDGDTWVFEGPDYCFEYGYINGSDLEFIADILER